MSDLTIPQIRDRIHEIADGIAPVCPASAQELHRLADATRRRPPIRRTPVKNRKITELLAQRIAAYAAAHPKASQQEIAVHFNVNTGRVSEVLAGKRGE